MVLRGGIGIIIDNPGIKEVQMWTDETTLRERFADIESLAAQCKYHDCKHGSDTGCAIRAAMQEGRLDAARFEGFLKLDDEIEKLRRSRKKRQMTVERRTKREEHAKAKKVARRRDGEGDDEPRERR
jgi:ribosome biogenesis GTPase